MYKYFHSRTVTSDAQNILESKTCKYIVFSINRDAKHTTILSDEPKAF
jgi:hypothetical protein